MLNFWHFREQTTKKGTFCSGAFSSDGKRLIFVHAERRNFLRSHRNYQFKATLKKLNQKLPSSCLVLSYGSFYWRSARLFIINFRETLENAARGASNDSLPTKTRNSRGKRPWSCLINRKMSLQRDDFENTPSASFLIPRQGKYKLCELRVLCGN